MGRGQERLRLQKTKRFLESVRRIFMKNKLKLAVIFTALFFSVVIFTQERQQAQTKIETAGQRFKSIKVLNEMPADQMGKVMNMMAASLGVGCNFCHAENDFAKEGFEHKDIARDMLRMTFDINKNYFNARTEINCNTCHQGKPHPPSGFPLSPNFREPRPIQPDVKPSVEAILAKYETALGGKANLAKITSRQITARRLEPDNKTFETELIWQKGNRLFIQTVYPSKQYGDYIVREFFDGAAGRKFGNDSEITLKPDEAEQIKREAELFANPYLRKIYSSIEFYRLEKIDGRAVYSLNAKTDFEQTEKLYFDVSTGLLVRRTASTPTVLGDHVFQVDYADYKNFGGVKLPTIVKFAVPQIYWTRKISSVKNNAAIDDAKFSKK